MKLDKKYFCSDKGTGFYYYDAKEVDKMLSEGVEVYFTEGMDHLNRSEILSGSATHKALLIGIEPIKKETAEDVLREWVEYMNGLHSAKWVNGETELFKRAKRVLGESE